MKVSAICAMLWVALLASSVQGKHLRVKSLLIESLRSEENLPGLSGGEAKRDPADLPVESLESIHELMAETSKASDVSTTAQEERHLQNKVYNHSSVAKEVVITAMGFIHYAGPFMSLAVDVFWPSGDPNAGFAKIKKDIDDYLQKLESRMDAEFKKVKKEGWDDKKDAMHRRLRHFEEAIKDFQDAVVKHGTGSDLMQSAASEGRKTMDCIFERRATNSLFPATKVGGSTKVTDPMDARMVLRYETFGLAAAFAVLHVGILKEEYLFEKDLWPGGTRANHKQELDSKAKAYHTYFTHMKENWKKWRKAKIVITYSTSYKRGRLVRNDESPWNGDKYLFYMCESKWLDWNKQHNRYHYDGVMKKCTNNKWRTKQTGVFKPYYTQDQVIYKALIHDTYTDKKVRFEDHIDIPVKFPNPNSSGNSFANNDENGPTPSRKPLEDRAEHEKLAYYRQALREVSQILDPLRSIYIGAMTLPRPQDQCAYKELIPQPSSKDARCPGQCKEGIHCPSGQYCVVVLEYEAKYPKAVSQQYSGYFYSPFYYCDKYYKYYNP